MFYIRMHFLVVPFVKNLKIISLTYDVAIVQKQKFKIIKLCNESKKTSDMLSGLIKALAIKS